MKYIKAFNESEDYGSMETEYGKFLGIDISDVHNITFAWSNVPHLSDYRTVNNKIGTSEKRISLSSSMKTILQSHGIKKDQFKYTLFDRGFDIKVQNDNSYSVELVGQEVIEFFYLIEMYAIKY